MRDFIELAWKEIVMLEQGEKALASTDGFKSSRASSIRERERSFETKMKLRRSSAQPSPAKQPSQSPPEKDPYDLKAQVRRRVLERAKMRGKLLATSSGARRLHERDEQAWEHTLTRFHRIENKRISFAQRH